MEGQAWTGRSTLRSSVDRKDERLNRGARNVWCDAEPGNDGRGDVTDRKKDYK